MDTRSSRTRWLPTVGGVALVASLTSGLLLGSGEVSSEQVGTSERSAPAELSRPSGAVGAWYAYLAEADDRVDQQAAVWPRPSSKVRFDDPVKAATSFARDYAQFDDPVIGEFRQGDSRSGEVPVQAFADGPETTVLVRQLEGDHWFVLGSVTEDITVDQPGVGDELSCPMVTSGTAVAFEGTVQVRIDAYDPTGERIEAGRGFVTGSGLPPAGPFEGEIDCIPPSGVEDFGIATFWTDDASGELQGPLQIVTIPIRLSR